MVSIIEHNAKDLNLELQWLENRIDTQLSLYTKNDEDEISVKIQSPPDLGNSKSYYAEFIAHYKLSDDERLALILALAPHISPQLLDRFFIVNARYNRGFTEFGGIKGQNHGGFIPTGETLSFLLAGNNLTKRFYVNSMFDQDHFFSSHDILKLEVAHANEPLLSGVLKISQEFLSYFTSGKEYKPDFNSEFPAKRIQTGLEWKDLVLDAKTMEDIDEIKIYVEYGHHLWNGLDMKAKLRPGFRSLFYGPPGTGKTLTACLLGKYTNREVYKIDLSMVVSKYVGETEKNLAKVFEKAEHKNWILFFDEADAIFGKRTNVEDAHDRFANQEVSYLLQRIEDFNGIVILASNMKANLDDAFARRFESMIHFQMPGKKERLKIWKNGFSENCPYDEKVDINQIATDYEMPGGAIMNVVRYGTIMAMKNEKNKVSMSDLKKGIRKEFFKEGRTV